MILYTNVKQKLISLGNRIKIQHFSENAKKSENVFLIDYNEMIKFFG